MTEAPVKHTRVEEGTALVGTMRSRCPVVINGTFEGEITAPVVDVTVNGTLSGTVEAQELSAHGTIGGNIIAEQVALAGRVLDETHIKASKLAAELPAIEGQAPITFGRCVLEVGSDPQASS